MNRGCFETGPFSVARSSSDVSLYLIKDGNGLACVYLTEAEAEYLVKLLNEDWEKRKPKPKYTFYGYSVLRMNREGQYEPIATACNHVLASTIADTLNKAEPQ